jgi:hypothetical protein
MYEPKEYAQDQKVYSPAWERINGGQTSGGRLTVAVD